MVHIHNEYLVKKLVQECQKKIGDQVPFLSDKWEQIKFYDSLGKGLVDLFEYGLLYQYFDETNKSTTVFVLNKGNVLWICCRVSGLKLRSGN